MTDYQVKRGSVDLSVHCVKYLWPQPYIRRGSRIQVFLMKSDCYILFLRCGVIYLRFQKWRIPPHLKHRCGYSEGFIARGAFFRWRMFRYSLMRTLRIWGEFCNQAVGLTVRFDGTPMRLVCVDLIHIPQVFHSLSFVI